MDGLAIITALVAAGAVFATALALQNSLGATRRVVQERTISTGRSDSNASTLTIQGLTRMSGRGRRIASDLERAGLAFTVNEYLLIRFAFTCGMALLAIFLVLSIDVPGLLGVIIVLMGLIVGYMLPKMYLQRRQEKRLRQVEKQLLETLVSLAKSLKAGVGLTQALEYAGKEATDPLGAELLRIVRELQLGADIEVVLEEMNQRVGSSDLEIASTAIILQRRVGGNLSEVLNNVAAIMRERRTIKNELSAITARGRLQANLSALIPVFVGALFLTVNWDTGKLMFTTTIGNIALAAGIFFEVMGIWMVRRFCEIEV